MAETDQTPPQQGATAPLVINGQYTKDLSFEAPNTPAVFASLQKEQPDVGINVDVKAMPLQDKIYEVQLHIHAECKTGGSVAFITELVYAGIFTVNVPDEHKEMVLLVECPRLLFPFARSIVADVSRDGGFPPLMLSLVDFLSMYNRNKQAATEPDSESEETTETSAEAETESKPKSRSKKSKAGDADGES